MRLKSARLFSALRAKHLIQLRRGVRMFTSRQFPPLTSTEEADALLEKASNINPDCALADYVTRSLHLNGHTLSLYQCHLHLLAHARNKDIKGCWESIEFLRKVGLHPTMETYEIVSWSICLYSTDIREVDGLLGRMRSDELDPSGMILSLLVRAAARLRGFHCLLPLLNRLLVLSDNPQSRFNEILQEGEGNAINSREFFRSLKANLRSDFWKHPEMAELLLSYCENFNDGLFLFCEWRDAELNTSTIDTLCQLLEKSSPKDVTEMTLRRAGEVLEDVIARGLASDRFLSALGILWLWHKDVHEAMRMVTLFKDPPTPTIKFLEILAKLCVHEANNFNEVVESTKDTLGKMHGWKKEYRACFLACTTNFLDYAHDSPVVPYNVLNDLRQNLNVEFIKTLNLVGVDVREFLTSKECEIKPS